MTDETSGLAIAYLAFAEHVAKRDPNILSDALAAAYRALDEEAQSCPDADLRLGYEITELAEAFDQRDFEPGTLLRRLKNALQAG
ncbi:hypothetical protein [Roseibium sediminis]|uniref:hypothetical protein n=1 Tax=Roseibium sediminis TaxID=1775174 RepID=UPI00123C99EB|nr:hypothetical protein [Roseibium sediminis]